jgi:hypothetical protein
MCIKLSFHCCEFNAVCTTTHYSLGLVSHQIPELSDLSLLKDFFHYYLSLSLSYEISSGIALHSIINLL